VQRFPRGDINGELLQKNEREKLRKKYMDFKNKKIKNKK